MPRTGPEYLRPLQWNKVAPCRLPGADAHPRRSSPRSDISGRGLGRGGAVRDAAGQVSLSRLIGGRAAFVSLAVTQSVALGPAGPGGPPLARGPFPAPVRTGKMRGAGRHSPCFPFQIGLAFIGRAARGP